LVFISAVVSYYANHRIFVMEGMFLQWQLLYTRILGFGRIILFTGWYGCRYTCIILPRQQYIIAVPTGIKIFSC
jgi:hypothetical protein